jgi:hypothetical protein
MIASGSYADIIGTYWKGSVIPKSTPGISRANEMIRYGGISILRTQNRKMVESWHVVGGLSSRFQEQMGDVYIGY